MADYSYIAIEKSGKEIKGSMESDSREKVEQKLRSQGCIPLEIKEQNALQKDIKIGVGKKVKTRDLSVFCRQFVSMLRAGVSIVEALDMLSIQTENKTLSQAIREVRTEIGKGSTLSEAMEKQNKVFPPMLVNICTTIGGKSPPFFNGSERGTPFAISSFAFNNSLLYKIFVMVFATLSTASIIGIPACINVLSVLANTEE